MLEISYNEMLHHGTLETEPSMGFEEYLGVLRSQDPALAELLQPGGEAHTAVDEIRDQFARRVEDIADLPFPFNFNADKSVALLAYGLVRTRKPDVVVETGVGYGISSALMLRALSLNGSGRLISIDLPSLKDSNGRYTGIAAEREEDRTRWTLHLGTSRRHLGRVLKEAGAVDMVVSDSANVHTLQRFEFELVQPYLRPGGVTLFNNVSDKFHRLVSSTPGTSVQAIRQIEKTSCTTLLVHKDGSEVD